MKSGRLSPISRNCPTRVRRFSRRARCRPPASHLAGDAAAIAGPPLSFVSPAVAAAADGGIEGDERERERERVQRENYI
ncbi:hypothetical protein Dimus_005639, partial [Dionaea muscipula]